MASPRVWLITGTSTGIGRAFTELVLAKGEIVVATARRPEALDDLKAKYPSDRLLVLKLDVSNADEIIAVFAQIKSTFGRLNVVVNNAGMAGTFGELESLSEAEGRAVLDTNFWGAMNVTRQEVAFFRDVNAPGVGGRLIQISSICGFLGTPAQAFYCASKFALEAVSESIAAEIDPEWNIKISLIQLGGFETEGIGKVKWSPAHPAYNKASLPVRKMRDGWTSYTAPGDVKKAVQVFYDIAGMQDPPLHIPIGQDAVSMAKVKLATFAAELAKVERLSENLNKD